jgi:hypothetical protein
LNRYWELQFGERSLKVRVVEILVCVRAVKCAKPDWVSVPRQISILAVNLFLHFQNFPIQLYVASPMLLW